MYAWMKLAENMRACGCGHACDVPDCKARATVVVDFEDGTRHLCRPHLADLIAIVTGECPVLFRSILGGEECARVETMKRWLPFVFVCSGAARITCPTPTGIVTSTNGIGISDAVWDATNCLAVSREI